MNLKKIKYVLLLLFCAGCKPELSELNFDNNGVDFSRYVAVGNSLTAGYMDAALYNNGQFYSYPSILATQFAVVGGGAFKQPLANSDVGFGIDAYTFISNSRLALKYKNTCNGSVEVLPDYVSATGDASVITNYVYNSQSGPFNNMGVPGIRSFQVRQSTFGDPNLIISKNPFYSRFASNPGTSTVLQDAVSQMPTFFTYWIGSNDVLGYAIAGADATLDSITTTSVFNNEVDLQVSQLASATSLKGAIANIPDILDIPYFNTIPYNGLTLDATTAATLNTLYTPINPAIQFTVGSNAFVMIDATAPGGMRQVKSTELVLLSLPLDSVKCAQWGSNPLYPLQDKYVLDSAEITQIRGAISTFNTKLFTVANNYDLAFVDINAFFKTAKSGYTFNGVTYTAEFVSGGAFSLDGIHPNPKGYALVANEFIKAINLKYASKIPMADANDYPGVAFP